VDEEHERAGHRSAAEDLGGALLEDHGRHRPELLPALDVVEPLEVLGVDGVGDQGPAAQGAGAELAAAVEPRHHPVVRKDVGDLAGEVLGRREGHLRGAQPLRELLAGPAAPERRGGLRLAEVPGLLGEVQGGPQGGPGVAGGGLDPDLVEGRVPPDPGVGHAVQGRAAGHGEHPVAGLPVQPGGEVHEDLLDHGLHRGGEVGVVAAPGAVVDPARGEAGPVRGLGREAAVAGGADDLAQLGQEAGLAVGGQRHDLELVGGAQEAEVVGEGLVEQPRDSGRAWRCRISSSRRGSARPGASAPRRGRRPPGRCSCARVRPAGGGGVGDVVLDEADLLAVQAGQRLGDEPRGAAGVVHPDGSYGSSGISAAIAGSKE
jgi:hypothetical protein